VYCSGELVGLQRSLVGSLWSRQQTLNSLPVPHGLPRSAVDFRRRFRSGKRLHAVTGNKVAALLPVLR